MAQQDVQNVLNTIMFKQQQQLAQQKQQQDVAQNQAENDLKQRQIDEARNRLQEEKRQFDLTYKATQALNELELQQREHNIIKGINEGTPAPGDTEVSRRPVQIAIDPDTNKPVMGEFVTHQLLTGHQVELLSPETLNKQEYYQVELPKIKAQQAAKQAEIDQTKKADLERYSMQKNIDMEKAKLHEDAETKRNDATNRTRQAIAAMKGGETYDVTPWVNGAISGDFTADDIKKGLPKSDAIATLNSLAKSGFSPITSKQQDFLANIKGTADTLNKMDEFLKLLPDSSSKGGGFLTGISTVMDADLKNLENEMAGRATVIARQIAQDKGNIPVKLLDRAVSGYIPSRYDPKTAAVKKRNDFAKDLDSMIESHLGNMTPQQKLLIKKKYGLDNLTDPFNQAGGVPAVPKDPASVFRKFDVIPTGK